MLNKEAKNDEIYEIYVPNKSQSGCEKHAVRRDAVLMRHIKRSKKDERK